MMAGMARLSEFLRQRNGASAVEFAIVSSMLTLIIAFIMVFGFNTFVGQSLDLATSRAARQIMTGAVQLKGLTRDKFRSDVFCKDISSTISCDDVVINVYKVDISSYTAGYFQFINDNWTNIKIPPLDRGQETFELGNQGEYQYMIAVYPVTMIPPVLSSVLTSATATYRGRPALLAIATAAFRNEKY
ncbi:TadE/TadG family type IV pilus assembly protein [Methylobacterium sp. JK268]